MQGKPAADQFLPTSCRRNVVGGGTDNLDPHWDVTSKVAHGSERAEYPWIEKVS
jgi:hypothetical protein